MTKTDKYVYALKQILNGANKVKYLWEPESELLIVRIISDTKKQEYHYFGIKMNDEGDLSFFYRLDNQEDNILPIRDFAKQVEARYSFIKPNDLKNDFLRTIREPLHKYEAFVANADEKAREKLRILEAILSH